MSVGMPPVELDQRGNLMRTADFGSVAARACCRRKPELVTYHGHLTRRHVLALPALTLTAISPGFASAAEAKLQLTWGLHISLAPTWFDPAETQSIVTPYMVMYAVHDALVKSMPGQLLAPSLAESWTPSDDGLSYEFVLRNGAKFHNGDAVTAEDVKFSFERYQGTEGKT